MGKFFQDFNFKSAGWLADKKNGWSDSWYKGDFDTIFSSSDFLSSNAFEDSPWFLPDFYKVLFNHFPNSKFILFIRDSDDWFQSMERLFRGNVIGRSRVHCKIYRRELEYFDLLHSGLINEEIENQFLSEKTMKLTGHANHYKEMYRLHNTEVQDFFHKYSPESLFVGKLEDSDKWQKLGKFLNIEVPADYICHQNKSL